MINPGRQTYSWLIQAATSSHQSHIAARRSSGGFPRSGQVAEVAALFFLLLGAALLDLQQV
jgi:hypothetical protein